MVFLFTYALVLPKEAGDELKAIIKEIEANNYTLGRKVLLFNTREEAAAFSERLSNLKGFYFKIKPVSDMPDSKSAFHDLPGMYSVSFVGRKELGKNEGEDVNEFLTSISQEKIVNISRESKLETTTSGTDLLRQEEDAEILASRDFKANKSSEKTRTAMQKAVVDFYLVISGVHPEGSEGESEQVTWAVLHQLAVNLGFKDDEQAVMHFLKSDYGQMFHEELKEAMYSGKFFVTGSATSEWMNDITDLAKQFKYARQRAEKIVFHLNSLFTEAGLEELAPPVLPTVYLVYQPTGKVRQKLIEWGMDEFSKHCSNPEALDKAQKYLEEYYGEKAIQENANRVFGYIHNLALEGDSEAIRAWNMLAAGKISCVSYSQNEDGSYSYKVTDRGNFNTLFSLKGGVLRTTGGILERALYLGHSRSGSFMFESQSTLGIEVMTDKTEFAPGEITIPLKVTQSFRKEDSTPRIGEFNGKVIGKVVDEAGNEVFAGEILPGNDGSYSAKFKGEPGKTYRMLFYAMNVDGEGSNIGDSGRAFWEAKVEEEANAYTSEVVKGEDVRTYHGETATVHFDSYKLTRDKEGNELKKESTASRFAFGLKLGDTQIEEFVNPYEATEKNNQWVQLVGDFEIPIDRSLVCESTKEKFLLKELKQWVTEGKVGRKFLDSRGGIHYFTLDGKNEFKIGGEGSVSLEGADGKLHEMEGFKVDGGFIVDTKNKGKNYETDRDVASFNRQANRVEPGKMSMKFYLQNSIAMPREDGRDIVMGDKTFTANEIRGKILDGTVAFVANASVDVENYGKIKTAVIFGPDGRVLGELSKMEQPLPSVRNLFLYHPNSGDMGFDMKIRFPEDSDASEIKIYPYTEFVLGRKIRVSAQK